MDTDLRRLIDAGNNLAHDLRGAPGIDLMRSSRLELWYEAVAAVERREAGRPTAKARTTDPPTSKLAALRNKPRAGSQRARLLAVITDSPAGATAEEAARAAGIRLNSASTRMSELLRGGHVQEVGRRVTSGGEWATVYFASEVG